jgi:hypothetical protein
MYLSYYSHNLVAPSTWQRNIHMGCEGITTKEKTMSAFDKINPSFGGIKSSQNGLSDAFFIARYGLSPLHGKFRDDWNFINMG